MAFSRKRFLENTEKALKTNGYEELLLWENYALFEAISEALEIEANDSGAEKPQQQEVV